MASNVGSSASIRALCLTTEQVLNSEMRLLSACKSTSDSTHVVISLASARRSSRSMSLASSAISLNCMPLLSDSFVVNWPIASCLVLCGISYKRACKMSSGVAADCFIASGIGYARGMSLLSFGPNIDHACASTGSERMVTIMSIELRNAASTHTMISLSVDLLVIFGSASIKVEIDCSTLMWSRCPGGIMCVICDWSYNPWGGGGDDGGGGGGVIGVGRP